MTFYQTRGCRNKSSFFNGNAIKALPPIPLELSGPVRFVFLSVPALTPFLHSGQATKKKYFFCGFPSEAENNREKGNIQESHYSFPVGLQCLSADCHRHDVVGGIDEIMFTFL